MFAKDLLHLDLTIKHFFVKLYTRVKYDIGNLTQIHLDFICIAYKFEIHLNILQSTFSYFLKIFLHNWKSPLDKTTPSLLP